VKQHRRVAVWSAARLTPGGLHMVPPDNWRCGSEPVARLPIDERITWLRRRKRAPKFRQDIKKILPCPYWYARFMTALAADIATQEAGRKDEIRLRSADRWKELANQAKRFSRELAEIFGASPPDGKIIFTEDRWTHHEAPAPITDAYEEVARAVSALSTIEQYARSRRKALRNKQPDIWRLTFVTQLGFAWRVLTGARPANWDPFIDFVTSAWESLAEEEQAINWDRSVRRALELY
jgi:hypothetical protein